MILAMRMQRGVPMPFLMDRHQIQPRAQRTSSIRQSFGKGGAGPCRHGHKARGQPIGRHTFYYPNEDTTGRAALSMGDLADPHVYDTSSQPLTEAVGFRSRAHVLSRNWRNGRRRYAISDAFGD